MALNGGRERVHGRKTFGTRMNTDKGGWARILRSRSDHALNLYERTAEVDNKACGEAGGAQVVQALRTMRAVQGRDRFQLHHHGRIDHKVGLVDSGEPALVPD